MQLDPIFAIYPCDGFQDIWFRGLTTVEVASLFEYACMHYGSETIHATWVQKTDENRESELFDRELNDVYYDFKQLLVGGEPLDDVCIRIENDALAVDFSGGLEYWTPLRQIALIHWLRALCDQAPNAWLEWAHEGFGHHPSKSETELLQHAVKSIDSCANEPPKIERCVPPTYE